MCTDSIDLFSNYGNVISGVPSVFLPITTGGSEVLGVTLGKEFPEVPIEDGTLWKAFK